MGWICSLHTSFDLLQLWLLFKMHLNPCIIKHLASPLHLTLLLASQLPLVLTEVDAQWGARSEVAWWMLGGWKVAYMLCRQEKSSSDVLGEFVKDRDCGDKLLRDTEWYLHRQQDWLLPKYAVPWHKTLQFCFRYLLS